MRVGWIIASICIGSAACSLFVDTDGFSNDPRTTSDGGPDVGSNADANVTNDAGGDGGATADAGRVCPDGGFCDSFERTTVLGQWEDDDSAGGCTLEIDTATASAGASSLKNFVAQAAMDGACEAFLFRGFLGTLRSLHYSFSVRVGEVPQRYLHIAGINVYDPSRALFFILSSEGIALAEQEFGANEFFAAYDVATFSPSSLKTGTFHRISLDHEIATKRTIVKVDDQTTLDRTTSRSFAASDVDVGLGNGYTEKGPPVHLWFDDVVFAPGY